VLGNRRRTRGTTRYIRERGKKTERACQELPKLKKDSRRERRAKPVTGLAADSPLGVLPAPALL